MLDATKAFGGFSVDSLERAKAFYGGTLGLEVNDVPQMPGILMLKVGGGTDTLIYEKPDHAPAVFTILNFPVDNVEQAVAELKQKGIKFESYDLPDMKTDADQIFRGPGIEAAWFTDPAGNIIALLKM
jgi:catechol 2,3-dioxygenase-like lactoylglutathione lyase family enzyme